MGRREYVLRIEAQEMACPAPIRLRRLLKLMLRQFGFRCVEVSYVGHSSAPDAPGGEGNDGRNASPLQPAADPVGEPIPAVKLIANQRAGTVTIDKTNRCEGTRSGCYVRATSASNSTPADRRKESQ
jgi:hypothetical protein